MNIQFSKNSIIFLKTWNFAPIAIQGNKIKHTANERFNAPKGYLVYNRASSLIKEDTNISVTAFFKTIDGIEEKGIWTYEIEFNKLYVNGEDRYIIELVRNR